MARYFTGKMNRDIMKMQKGIFEVENFVASTRRWY